jgi:hypoxanthine phosphoribosyltransferase
VLASTVIYGAIVSASNENFKYTFKLYQQGIKKLAKDIKASNIEFDYMLGVSRGGAIPAVHLSSILEIPLDIVHWSSFSANRLVYPDNFADPEVKDDLLHGKKILLVEDIIDHGKTVKQLLSEWTSHRFFEFTSIRNMKVASMIFKPNNKCGQKADFYHIEHPGRFVDFWWDS